MRMTSRPLACSIMEVLPHLATLASPMQPSVFHHPLVLYFMLTLMDSLTNLKWLVFSSQGSGIVSDSSMRRHTGFCRALGLERSSGVHGATRLFTRTQ